MGSRLWLLGAGVALACFSLSSCYNAARTGITPAGPPLVSSLAPSTTPAGGAGFTLTVNGTNFAATSVVDWNASARTTTFVSATQLTAAILASDITSAGAAQVTVVNPAPSGTSAAMTFTISAALNPAPTISSLVPSSTPAGGAAFTLTVNGQGFIAASKVNWNGTARVTAVVSATQVTAAILASDITSTSTAQVTVTNPTPGGGTSAASTFTITAPGNPVPSLSSLLPSSQPAGAAAFTLTVNGSNFIASSVVNWNGSARTTTFVSATQLTAAITAADIVAQGTAQITVTNPTPGGGTTGQLAFTITPAGNPLPQITTVAPAAVSSGGAAFTLTVNGANFIAASQVQWNGNNRATTFVNANQLTAQILAADIASPSNGQVTVVNPGPGGGTSGAAVVNVAGAIQRVSVSTSGAQGDQLSEFPAISSTGRYVSFESFATTLVPGGVAPIDIYLRDTCTAAPVGCTPSTIRISVASDGSPGNNTSANSSISADGRFVAFDSDSTNLIPNDNNFAKDVFIRDTCNGAPAGCTPSTILASQGSSGQSNNLSEFTSLSSSGRFIAFSSFATNLIPGGVTNGHRNIYVRDTCLGAGPSCIPQTALASVDSGNNESDGDSILPVLSADGRFVTFESGASNLVPGNSRLLQIYLRDTCFNAPGGCRTATTMVSVDSNGNPGNDNSNFPSMSGNGRFVGWTSPATNLVPGDSNGVSDSFVRDTCFGGPAGCTPSTFRASVTFNGAQSNGSTGISAFSNDGRLVAFISTATNLAAVAGSGFPEVFLRDTCIGAPAGCTPTTIMLTPGKGGTEGLAMSADGHFIAFTSQAVLVPNDTNNAADIFLVFTTF